MLLLLLFLLLLLLLLLFVAVAVAVSCCRCCYSCSLLSKRGVVIVAPVAVFVVRDVGLVAVAVVVT